MVYNSDTIESASELTYDPPTLSKWDTFWRGWNKWWQGPIGTVVAISLFTAASILAIFIPAFLPIYIATLSSTVLALAAGGAIAGYRRRNNGNSFWENFCNYINENWAQEVAISMTLAMVSFGIRQAAQAIASSGVCNGTECFIAGTLVLCKDEDGNECHKPIEEIEVGDSVWAYNEKTDESDWKPVVRLFRNETKEWYHITVNGEEIVCTGGHPFYVVGKGFVHAKNLTTDDKLLLANGQIVEIDKISIQKLAKPETTYNFEVQDAHTYYVTQSDVLVHNKCWEWGKGSYNSAEQSLQRHFDFHGKEVGAIDPSDYFEIAKNYADDVLEEGIFIKKVSGVTKGVERFTLGDGLYIDIVKKSKTIISFGEIWW